MAGPTAHMELEKKPRLVRGTVPATDTYGLRLRMLCLCLLLGLTAPGHPQPIISPISSPIRVSPFDVVGIPFIVIRTNAQAPVLTVRAESSDQTIIPNRHILCLPTTALGAMNYTLEILAGVQTGYTVITVTASDEVASSSESFTLEVLIMDDFFWLHHAPLPISIPNNSPGFPYPSTTIVENITGAVSRVEVRVNGFTHSYESDVGMLLVAPDGRKTVLMNHAGLGQTSALELTFSPVAKYVIPQNAPLISGFWKPADYQTNGYSFFAPAPPGPYVADLDNLKGSPAAGTWSLYVQDDFPVDAGEITNWSLRLEIEPRILGLVDTNLVEGIHHSEPFHLLNPAMIVPPLNFRVFPSDSSIMPLENLRVQPLDETGTNFALSMLPQTSGSNLWISVFATDATGTTLNASFHVDRVVRRPTLQIQRENDRVKIKLMGSGDAKYTLQRSADLRIWTDLGVFTISAGGFIERDVTTLGPGSYFFRALTALNPL